MRTERPALGSEGSGVVAFWIDLSDFDIVSVVPSVQTRETTGPSSEGVEG